MLGLINFNAIFEFSDNLLQDNHIIFQKSIDNFEIAFKTFSISVSGAIPLKWLVGNPYNMEAGQEWIRYRTYKPDSRQNWQNHQRCN